ncbi:programmed cell death protein 2-like [Esox lucius]|uniref:Programmed cell death protein 2 C-terminal domain-containing protein n=1 Tax=Esox lucius TaxID=8010 RepID=A0AAY5KUQ7_ESOLU|nr:programmed cell death protein 2-like [Esox lucius]
MAAVDQAVLIGLCDGAIDSKQYPTSYFTNKIGDKPNKLPKISTWQHPRCGLCSAVLGHVLQVYCPLAASPYHRTFNVFACTGPHCSGKPESWRVLRSQVLESEVKTNCVVQSPGHGLVEEVPVATTDWCDGADDWGEDNEKAEEKGRGCDMARTQAHTRGEDPDPETRLPTRTSAELDVSGRLQDLCLEGGEPQDNIPNFSPFYISVVEETDLAGETDLAHAESLLREYEQREGVAVGAIGIFDDGGGGKEVYEKVNPRHGDAVFSRFMKRISVCPEQVLRYSWNGSPLFLAPPPSDLAMVVPGCGLCGGTRGFEFQLMPALVTLLQRTDPGAGQETALEFGTVMVFTCRNSCWLSGSTSPVEEFVYLQADPDQKLFK